MGAGLWLPLAAASAIATDPRAAARTREALAAAGSFAFTVNAFPLGGFHGASVKAEVYRPTWGSPARREYTELACRALAALLPEGGRGSVSTVPVGYTAFAEAGVEEAAGAALGSLAAALERLEAETGRSIAIALEPEPLAVLETAAGAVDFFEAHVLRGPGPAAFAAAGGSAAGAEGALRRRVGVCVDTCHLACVFEDLPGALARLAAAGVSVVKAQLSSALELAWPAHDPQGLARLRSFAEPRYLHQTVGRRPDGSRVSFADLPELTLRDGAPHPDLAGCERVRTHFHVPLCWEGDAPQSGPGSPPEGAAGALGTTRPALEAGLAALVAATDHLEVETYTFDVLPAAERARYGGDPVRMIAAELAWAEAALRGVGAEPC
ncbi:MAG: metabolite traffic protein EboE [Planctomycetota bacterium]